MSECVKIFVLLFVQVCFHECNPTKAMRVEQH